MPVNPNTSRVLALLNSPNDVLRGLIVGHVREAPKLAEAMRRCTDQRAQLLESVNVTSSAWAKVIAETVDALIAARPIKFAEKAHQARTVNETAEAGLQVLDSVEQRLSDRLVAQVQDARDTMLCDLHRAVVDLIGEARRLQLADVKDADQAIADGRADEWAAMSRLRDRYKVLRHAQQSIVALDREGTARQYHGTFAWIRNYADLYPDWLAGGRDDGGIRYGVTAPWPDDEAGRFRWLVDTADAEPWVPTPAELEAVVTGARTAARIKQAENERRPSSPADRAKAAMTTII